METHEYGIECGNVDNTLPMLLNYYHTIGVYTISSDSSSSISSSVSSSGDESEYEKESSHYNGKSDNSSLSESEVHATPHIDVRQFFVASTSDYELSDYITTDTELWSTSLSSPSSLCTSTSEFSQEPLPSFAHLLDYSPTSAEQPQPTDTILVPKECMWDVKLRCPPDVEIIRSPMVEQAIRSFQDHLPPNVEDDVQIINTSPEYIEETSDSDVVCLN